MAHPPAPHCWPATPPAAAHASPRLLLGILTLPAVPAAHLCCPLLSRAPALLAQENLYAVLRGTKRFHLLPPSDVYRMRLRRHRWGASPHCTSAAPLAPPCLWRSCACGPAAFLRALIRRSAGPPQRPRCTFTARSQGGALRTAPRHRTAASRRRRRRPLCSVQHRGAARAGRRRRP